MFQDTGSGDTDVIISDVNNFAGLSTTFDATDGSTDFEEIRQDDSSAFNILGSNSAETWNFTGVALTMATVRGEGGADSITASNVTDNVYLGGNGDDDLIGQNRSDTLYGGANNDSLSGGNGSDFLSGGTGTDSLDGGDGNDTFFWASGDGRDVFLDTGSGDTDVIISDVNDFAGLSTTFDATDGSTDFEEIRQDDSSTFNILGSNAAETWNFTGVELTQATILGEGGADDITASNQTSNSYLGGAGNDTLTGQSQSDVLNGGNNDDVLAGGLGDDTLSGGAGSDDFMFVNNAIDADLVLDYSISGDTLTFSGFGVGTALALDGLVNSITNNGTDTTVNFGGGDTIVFENVVFASFDELDTTLGGTLVIS